MIEPNQSQATFKLKNDEQAISLLGVNDDHVQMIEETLAVSLHVFANQIEINGPAKKVKLALQVLEQLAALLAQGNTIGETDVQSALAMAQRGTLSYFKDLYQEILIMDAHKRPIRVKNLGQRDYVQTVRHHDVTFGVGPAGTGKTFLAVVLAISALQQKQVERIILTRPAVEAGESLGFLPGDLKEKVDPYLRPLYDALYMILGTEKANRLIERGIIEIALLAYMRGRTLDDAFVILDEAQNTMPAQMRMFLTRLGVNSKMIVNGDLTQVDLPTRQESGLRQAIRILHGVEHLGFVEFSSADVVRHPVVARIIDAYQKYDQEQREHESRNH